MVCPYAISKTLDIERAKNECTDSDKTESLLDVTHECYSMCANLRIWVATSGRRLLVVPQHKPSSTSWQILNVM